MTRKGCVAVGYGGKFYKDAPYILTWLPKGYGPTKGDRYVGYFAEPPNGWGKSYGLAEGRRPPLIEAVCKTIEKFMKDNPDYEIGVSTWSEDET